MVTALTGSLFMQLGALVAVIWSQERQAQRYERLLKRIEADRNAALEETKAYRIAIFPALARIEHKQAPAPAPAKPTAAPEQPLSKTDRIAAIWANRTMPTRQKLKEITRICNTKQARIDQINRMAAQAEQAAQTQEQEKPNNAETG